MSYPYSGDCESCGWLKGNHGRLCPKRAASVLDSLPKPTDRVKQPPYPTEGERAYDAKH